MDLIERQAAIDILDAYQVMVENGEENPYAWARLRMSELPSAQQERIQNNALHLCDSCQYTYVTCPSHGNDAVFGDGKGNDNICACNKYRPISAQPERKKGEWIPAFDGKFTGGAYWFSCSKCKRIVPEVRNGGWNFCPQCGADMREGNNE
jgi:hypothetical protein